MHLPLSPYVFEVPLRISDASICFMSTLSSARFISAVNRTHKDVDVFRKQAFSLRTLCQCWLISHSQLQRFLRTCVWINSEKYQCTPTNTCFLTYPIYLPEELWSSDLLSWNPKESWRVHKIPSKQSTILIFWKVELIMTVTFVSRSTKFSFL